MKHSGKARQAALRLIVWATAAGGVVLCVGTLGNVGSTVFAILMGLITLWILFVLFTLYFFRDPEPRLPAGAGLVVSPGHGKVDVIDETTESEFIGGSCQRISIFLSVFDVHVQNAPVEARVAFFKYKHGKFLNALRTECAAVNENVLIGFAPKERPGEKLGVRLVAGVIARRIVPWVAEGEEVARGERISLIQFGSRVELYLPRSARIRIKLGDKVIGGETVVAVFE
jgi:phosphatidylserine decarboxylase